MISTGCKDLNEFIEGYQGINCIFGPSATGKTTMAKLATVEQCKLGKKVIYLDVEDSFSLDRFKQLAGEDYKKLLDNLLLFKIKNFNEQHNKIQELEKIIKKTNVSLIIIDTLSIYYRRILKRIPEIANKMLMKQLRILKYISETIPVIITNQVYDDVEGNGVRMVGGSMPIRASDRIIELQKEPRKLICDEKELLFDINEKGISKLNVI